jgi:hypothetical protein
MKNIIINLKYSFISKVKFKVAQYIKFKKQLYFLKKLYWNMINNLTDLNLLNYYKEFNNFYLEIISNMEQLQNYLDYLPNKFQLHHINQFKYYHIIKLRKQLINVIHYICPTSIKSILELYDLNLSEYFTDEENVQLLLYIDFVRPIYLWDSINHIYKKKDDLKNNVVNVDSNSPNNFNNQIIKNILIQNGLNIKETKESTDIIKMSDTNVTEEVTVNNEFDVEDCEILLLKTNIVIQKNKKAISLLENKYGCSIFIKLPDRYLVIQGIFKDDLFNMAIKNPYAKKIIDTHILNNKLDLVTIPITFYESYFSIMNLRDKIVLTSKQISDEIKKKYNDFKNIQTKPLMLLINEFLLGSKYRKIDILTLFLFSNEDDQKIAYILFDIFKSKDKKNITVDIYNALHHTIRKKLDIAKLNVENDEKELNNVSESDISYEKKISLLEISYDIKIKAMDKLRSIKNNFQGDSKAQNWLDGLLKIPFNIYNENEIISFKKNFINKLNIQVTSDNEIEKYLINDNTYLDEWTTYKNDKKEYLMNVRKILDKSVYGHKDAKLQIERIFAQWINGENKGAVLGLHGPPGTGKTSLIKNGLSKCLKDINGKPRPFAFLPIGGSVNGSTLVGHNYTYVGSSWGRIVDILMTSKCMNPIIFIDELDKVSNTEQGREIISILTHLTDSTQNDEFEDKFFSGIKLDLSKVLFIFSFNDISLIDHVLKDRITIIETNPLKINEKITIIQDYMLPEITKEIGFTKDEIIINNNLIKYLIETYTLEPGVRKIKEKIVEIIREINLNSFKNSDIIFPYTVTQPFCDQLFELKHKIKITKIIDTPTVGIVNGLYASVSSIGGITYIQAVKFPSSKMLELNITGSLGDSMKESIEYSLKVALRLIPCELLNTIIEDANKKSMFGIHIHCPQGAVKKDGPSAGAAITLAIYSLLTNRKVNNKIALTGEIDIIGNITAIGGLDAKLNGAKKAGVELALFPKDNLEDIEIMRKEGLSPEDDMFKIIPVSNIQEVLDLCLL